MTNPIMPSEQLKNLEAEGSPRPFRASTEHGNHYLLDANNDVVATFTSRSDLAYACAAFNGFTEAANLLDWLNTELAKRASGGENVKTSEQYCDHVFEAYQSEPNGPSRARCQKCFFAPSPIQLHRLNVVKGES